MATLKKIRLPDGKEITLADWGAYPLRSTCELLCIAGGLINVNEIRIFTYTVGQQVPTSGRPADELDCNNNLPSQMPMDEEMLVYTMQIELDARLVPQSVRSIVMRTLFTLSVGGVKNYTDGPVTRYPAGGGISGFSVITNESVLSNGMPGVHAAKQLAIPVHIAGGEKFWGIYRFFQRAETAALGATPIALVNQLGAALAVNDTRQIVTYLDGLRKRPLS